jgi:hypothetical protein
MQKEVLVGKFIEESLIILMNGIVNFYRLIRYGQELEKRYGPYEKNPSLHDYYYLHYIRLMQKEDKEARQRAIERAKEIRKQEEEKKRLESSNSDDNDVFETKTIHTSRRGRVYEI